MVAHSFIKNVSHARNRPTLLISLPEMADTSASSAFKLLGVFQVGADVSFILLGVLLLQAYFYFEHYPNDRRWIQIMVRSSNDFRLTSDYRVGWRHLVCDQATPGLLTTDRAGYK